MSVYMDFDEVRIYQFNRLIRDLGPYSRQPEAFLEKLRHKFEVVASTDVYCPDAEKHLGMYLAGQWYVLKPLPELYAADPVGDLDVTVLHEHILKPLLNIHDPRTDARITYEGGLTPASELSVLVDSGAYDVAFTLCPTSVSQIIKVAEAGAVMPPKSTWVEPKFLVGLLTNCFGGPA